MVTFRGLVRCVIALSCLTVVGRPNRAHADESPGASFDQDVRSFFVDHCVRCHGPDEMEAGIRVDQLTDAFEERQLLLWRVIARQVANGVMPPEDEVQPTEDQRTRLLMAVDQGLIAARMRDTQRHGVVRRLTVSQYHNTLCDLLGLQEDLTGILPPNAVSKAGFTNHADSMVLSPLLVETYFEIARKALDRCIVDEHQLPEIQNFWVELGQSINGDPCPDELILGAGSLLLANQDFVVRELRPIKPFSFRRFRMQSTFDFIEGYQGNATVRGWRHFDSLYHAVFACMRGSPGYPLGEAYTTVPDGLLLRPAIPSPEIFGESNTLGPQANFKIALRELPDHGNFRVKVRAARYDDAMLLKAGGAAPDSVANAIEVDVSAGLATVDIRHAGVYQMDFRVAGANQDAQVSVTVGGRRFDGSVTVDGEANERHLAAFIVLRLTAGPLPIRIAEVTGCQIDGLRLTHLIDSTDETLKRFSLFERRAPIVGVHVGLRRDCGSTLARVGTPQSVTRSHLQEFIFEGAICDFPSPDVEPNNVNYLAGVREIAVRSEYTDGRPTPRLLVRSVEFEGPYYESWPPITHRRIFIPSQNRDDPHRYAREIIVDFASRAFRRPATEQEVAAVHAVWERSFLDSHDFIQSVKDALLVVLTSPQFLFLIEDSHGPESEPLSEYELASKLSYFLWNSAPDELLLRKAQDSSLQASLHAEVDRMIDDPRFEQFASVFGTEWLGLDRFDVVSVDRKRYPRLTRETKAELRKEPIATLRYLIRQNLSLRHLIQSDIALVNDVVSEYYRLETRPNRGLDFVAVRHGRDDLGGLLTQASLLSGLSDGRHPHPIKRGAWLARKIIAEPPEDPPPNVPEITDDDPTLTLREKLARHRDQKGCANCHAGIDPWGLPFQSYDAGGLFTAAADHDTTSTLPDGTEVRDLGELKAYLANDRIDRVAFSFLWHLATYATGRSLSYHEVVFLEEEGLQLKPGEYRMRDMVHWIVRSEIFQHK